MSDYYNDLLNVRAAGHQHALDHMANGTTTPVEDLFSGEWSDGLTGQDALDYAHVNARFADLHDFEQADIYDAFEDGYNSAPWPADGNGHNYADDADRTPLPCDPGAHHVQPGRDYCDYCGIPAEEA